MPSALSLTSLSEMGTLWLGIFYPNNYPMPMTPLFWKSPLAAQVILVTGNIKDSSRLLQRGCFCPHTG